MDNKEERKYHCYFCGRDFKRNVRKVGEGKMAGSTQVKCECGNFVKTWK